MSEQPIAFRRPAPNPDVAPEIGSGAGSGKFPTVRMRRNRRTDWSRRLVAENALRVEDMIWPLFVHDNDVPAAVPSMPGVQRLPIPMLVERAALCARVAVGTGCTTNCPAPSLTIRKVGAPAAPRSGG